MLRALLTLIALGYPAAPAPAQEAIPPETLQEIKAATVFVKTKVGTASMSGSGFVLKVDGDSALVATNHHVIAPPRVLARGAKPAVSLVFLSGTRDERVAEAEVLASDPQRDLAILRVKGFQGLPRPIDYSRAPTLTETMPVYTFGFPFGQLLSMSKGNPAITVGRGSVSSVRLDDAGRAAVVQVDGALNPGNSGGPVVDAQGRLIGIAVATIRGAHIGLAIPPDHLVKMLDGRLADFTLTTRLTDAGVAAVKFSIQLVDPMSRIKSVKLRHARADPSGKKPEPNPDGTWAPLAESQEVDLSVDAQRAAAEFTVRSDERTRVSYWWQTSYTDGSGRAIHSAPKPFVVNFAAAVATARLGPGGIGAAPSQEDEPRGGFPKQPETDRTRKQALARSPTPVEEPQGGFAKELLGPDLSIPRATGETLEGETWTESDLTGTEINVRAGQVPRCIFWGEDGKTFFVLEQSGTLRRIALDGFREEMHWEVGKRCSWLSPSAEGLVLTVAGLQEVWLIDAKDFRVKAKAAIPSADRAVSAPTLSVAFAIGADRQARRSLHVVDLKTGEVAREYGPADFGDQVAVFGLPAVTPNGKYLFTEGMEMIQRFRILGDELHLEEVGRRNIRGAAQGRAVEISPDGYYVAQVTTNGNGPLYATNVFKITDLSKPEIVIASGPHPAALGFDIKAGFVYAQNDGVPLIVFRPSGIRHKEYTLASPSRMGGRARQFIVHPDGGKLLVLTDIKLVFVEWPRKG
jgi:S1-C subfamily serine protease